MNDPELQKLIASGKPEKVLSVLAALPQSDRRAHGKAVLKWYREAQENLRSRIPDGLIIALLATATLSDLKKVWYPPLPNHPPIDVVLQTLAPEWLQDWLDWMLADNPFRAKDLAPIWQNGLCPRPTSDAFILGYYTHAAWNSAPADEAALLEIDVWRFFEVEGGGEFSLASHDKYTQPANSWHTRLLRYADQGKLDRQRLLDASLDALERDFAQFRGGWYSRFHTALNPSLAETTARKERYLGLLNSAIPPTVSFAMKAVQALEKAGEIPPARLLDALEAPLQARQKGTVTAALRLVAAAARRDATLSGDAALAASRALVFDAADVQGKVLDLVEKLGATEDPQVREELAQHLDLVAPSVKPRLAELLDTALPDIDQAPQDTAAPLAAQPVQAARDSDKALSLLLAILENPRDPIEVERAMDGLSRFGTALRNDGDILSPLMKRSIHLSRLGGDREVLNALALTTRAFCEGIMPETLFTPSEAERGTVPIRSGIFANALLVRNAELIRQVLAGQALPMMSLPSDSSGQISPADLVARLDAYAAEGVTPGTTDLSLALLRLHPEGRTVAMPGLSRDTEADRAVAYAFGADTPPETNAPLWAAAWAARLPVVPDSAITALFHPPLPDCGKPSGAQLKVGTRRSDEYRWITVEAPVPLAKGADTDAALPAMFYPSQPNRYWNTSPCGYEFEDVAWSSLVRSAAPEPFFRDAVLNFDTDQKLSDHYACGYLEPVLRPGPSIGPFGAAMLGYYLASADKSVVALTIEAIALSHRAARLDAGQFAAALKPFLMSGALPTARWTKAFAALAEAGESAFVLAAITGLLDFEPQDTPRDIGGMIELYFELHIAAGSAPDNPATLACLSALPGGGKVAKFARKLIAMAG